MAAVLKLPALLSARPRTAHAPSDAGRMAALTRSAERYDKAVQKAALDKAALQPVNEKLIQIERGLTLPDGLPGRPWFQHQIYAPGL